VAGDFRRQRHRRLLLLTGGGAWDEGGARRTDRQHFERRRAGATGRRGYPPHEPANSSRVSSTAISHSATISSSER
jgi:hypothetical protein